MIVSIGVVVRVVIEGGEGGEITTPPLARL